VFCSRTFKRTVKARGPEAGQTDSAKSGTVRLAEPCAPLANELFERSPFHTTTHMQLSFFNGPRLISKLQLSSDPRFS